MKNTDFLDQIFDGDHEHVRRHSFGTNETIFMEECSAHSTYLVEVGCVRMVVFPQDGKQLVLRRASAGETFGEEHLSSARNVYRAIADEPSKLLAVENSVLLSRLKSDSRLSNHVIGRLGNHFLRLLNNFERLGISPAQSRVFHLLNSLCSNRKQIDLTGKIKSLSDDLNLTPEATYRAIKGLEQNGMITRNRGIINIC